MSGPKLPGAGWLLSLALYFLALPGPLQAQPPSGQRDREPPKAANVSFSLDPSYATVWRQTGEGRTNYLGRSDEVVSIGLTEQEASGGRDVFIVFKVPLWFSEWSAPPEFIPADRLLGSARYPEQGKIRLGLSRAERLQGWTRAHPGRTLAGFFALLALPFSGLWLVRLYRRRITSELPLIPDYTLGEKIGEGGMGVVYAAVDSHQQPVAVKFLRPLLSEGKDFQKAFDRELSVCRNLQHPNLLRLFGYGVATDGRAYMVTELLQGVTLKDKIGNPGEQAAHLAAEVLEQVGAALDYLHAQKYVHMDVKPSNIFCLPDGTLKLLDLGISQVISSARQEEVVGTPLYMAPEQFEGWPVPASDQYSLGLVLYEVLVGRKPFVDKNPTIIHRFRTQERPEPPSFRATNLTSEVDEAILKMLEARPELRFESLAGVRSVLTDQLMKRGWTR